MSLSMTSSNSLS
uniref:Uncharacterized protein n=1 Tax=Rhizophora mucronata TaxID=61149 RepID=A0A2P2IVL8_RHIMU